MKPVRCYIGMGSNLGQPSQQIKKAAKALQQDSSIQLLDMSPLYRSKAVGPGEQPDYCNAVAKIDTTYPPLTLLGVLQAIEKSQGRDRQNNERWGARTLDLDILMYGDEQISSPELRVPHVEISNRNFVLRPLTDISVDLVIPGVGKASDLLVTVGEGDLQPWAEGAA